MTGGALRPPSGPLGGAGAAIVSCTTPSRGSSFTGGSAVGRAATPTGPSRASPFNLNLLASHCRGAGDTFEAAKAGDNAAHLLSMFGAQLRDDLGASEAAPGRAAVDEPTQERIPGASKTFHTLSPSETLFDYYTIERELQSDESGDKVVTGRRRSDSSEVVIKFRSKIQGRGDDRAWRNVMSQLLRMQANPYVLDIQEILEDDSSLYVVMPKCDGGELWSLVESKDKPSEAECRDIIRQLLVAVGHLHSNNLIHRDIKLDNIMFDSNSRSSSKTRSSSIRRSSSTCSESSSTRASPRSVRLIDFDNCESWMPGTAKKLHTIGGTEGFIAPEALCGTVSPQSDLWSVGVIFYILMTQHAPFRVFELEDWTANSRSAMKTYNVMKQTVLDWGEAPWRAAPLARDLCQQLLEFRPQKRPASTRQALAHEWFAAVPG